METTKITTTRTASTARYIHHSATATTNTTTTIDVIPSVIAANGIGTTSIASTTSNTTTIIDVIGDDRDTVFADADIAVFHINGCRIRIRTRNQR